MEGWARPMRLGVRPPSCWSSGTVIQSAMASNMEIEMSAPCSAARPRQQRFQDRLIGVHPGGDVDHGDADPRRRVRPAGDGGEARFRLDQQVIGLAPRIRAALAIARHRAGDQPGIVAAQTVEAEAEPRHRAGLEVLHEHVGLRQHRLEQGLVGGLHEIEHDGFLAAVEPHEIGAFAVDERVIAAREVAFRTLDLDDAGARIGEPAGAHGRRHRLLQRHDEEAGEG